MAGSPTGAWRRPGRRSACPIPLPRRSSSRRRTCATIPAPVTPSGPRACWPMLEALAAAGLDERLARSRRPSRHGRRPDPRAHARLRGAGHAGVPDRRAGAAQHRRRHRRPRQRPRGAPGRRRGAGRLRRGAGRRRPQRVLRRASAGPPRRARRRHGVLRLQQRGDRGAAPAAPSRRGARAGGRLRLPPRQRHRGDVLRRPHRLHLQLPRSPRLPPHRAAGAARDRRGGGVQPERAAARRGPPTTICARRTSGTWSPPRAPSPPISCSWRPGSTAMPAIRSATWR